MTPGKMLCLSKSDTETYDASLAELTRKGLLVQESFQGAYSLTESGYAAMNNGG